MIPQTIRGDLVRAAYRVPTQEVEQYHVIVEDGEKFKFIVWRVALTRTDGVETVEASWGHYDLTWERASKLFADRCGLVPEPLTDVWVVSIEHRHGTNIFAFRTRESARDAVEAYVKEWWEMELPDFEMPDNLEARVEEYFERTNESYTITKNSIGD